MHGARHLFQREEQLSVGIRAWAKALVSKRRTDECCNTCRGQGICFNEKNSRCRIPAWDKAFVSKIRTAECWNTCIGQGIFFKEKNSRVLEYVQEARHLFQSEEQPSVGIRAWGKVFVSKRRTAMFWNTCMG